MASENNNNINNDDGSIETIKESPLVLEDLFGTNIRIFEAALNYQRIGSKEYDKLRYYICPQAYVYLKSQTPAKSKDTLYYTMELVAYNSSANKIAQDSIIEDITIKSDGRCLLFSKFLISRMTHGVASITFRLNDIKTEPVTIGSPNQKVSLSKSVIFQVPVPISYQSLFENHVRNKTLVGELIIQYSARNLNLSSFTYDGKDIVKSNYFKKVTSGGGDYFNANQVADIVKQSCNEINSTAYRDPNAPTQLSSFAEEIFKRSFENLHKEKEIQLSQHEQINKQLLNGTGISPDNFTPTKLLIDTYNEISDITDHNVANQIIKDKFTQNENVKKISAGGSYGFGPFKASVKGSMENRSLESNHDYFSNNEELNKFHSKNKIESGKRLVVYPSGLGLVEKSTLIASLESSVKTVSYYPTSAETELVNNITILDTAQYTQLISGETTNPIILDTNPVGMVASYAGKTAPLGYLFCNGQEVSRREYPKLFQAIGTQFGGDGVNTFNLPDLRGRSIVGVGHSPNLTNRIIGQKGGLEAVALDISHLAAHDHNGVTGGGNPIPYIVVHQAGPICNSLHVTGYAGGPNKMYGRVDNREMEGPENANYPASRHTHNIPTQGENQPHENMHPFICLNNIIKAI